MVQYQIRYALLAYAPRLHMRPVAVSRLEKKEGNNARPPGAHLFVLIARRLRVYRFDSLLEEQGGRRPGDVLEKVQRQEVALVQRERQEHLSEKKKTIKILELLRKIKKQKKG